MKLTKLAVLALAATTLFISCKKDDNTVDPQVDDSATAMFNAAREDEGAQAHYDEVFKITLGVQSSDAGEDIGIGSGADIIYSSDKSSSLQPETPDSARCFTVTVDSKALRVFPKTVILDFGTGCIGKDGKLRSGKIMSVYTGPVFITGSKVTTTLIDYHVDSFKLEGTQVIENTSTTAIRWTHSVTGGKITNTSAGKWKTWSSTRTNTQIEGMGTPFLLADDIYQVTGNGSGSTSQNNFWTAEITVPLIWRFGCKWISKGILHLTRNNMGGDLSYGDGGCDNKAILTVNGKDHEITLHK